jgi:hypothetical protein
MILLCSLGMWSVAFGLMFLRLRRKTEPALLFFPLLLIVNYLLMALGLSLNTGSGASDEFQNRPLVWVYFGVVSWTSGAAYACAFGKCPPRGHSVRLCVVVLVLSSFVVPWRLARDLQTFPAWRGYAGFDEFASFPSCLINAAQYIREQSQPGNVIQDSENDAQMFVGAFAEREEFADNWIFGEIFKGTALKERINDLRSFKEITNQADLLAFARKNKISWYLLRPETKVSWPKSFLSTFSFDCDGYRVYRFPIR